MKKLISKLYPALLVLAMCLGAMMPQQSMAQANLLLNGGFELGQSPAGTFSQSSTYGAWTANFASQTALLGMPYAGMPVLEGTNAMHIGNGFNAGSVSQTFATTIGVNYQVSLWVIGWSGGIGSGTVRVFSGATNNLLSNFSSPAGNVWTQNQFVFTASGTFTTIELKNITTAATTIDNVSVMSAGCTAAPTITCAPGVTINTTPGLCTGTTTLTAPTVINNCNGNALDFDGVNDYVNIPHSASLAIGSNPVSVECWFTAPNVNQAGFIVAKRQPVGPYNMLAIFINDGTDPVYNPLPGKKLTLTFGNAGSSSFRTITTVNNIVDGGTHHLAAVVDPVTQTLKLYIDGVLQVVNTINPGVFPSVNNTDPFTIGQANGNSWFLNFKVDELRIWNTARTQAHIQANMNNELNAQAGLVAAYHFNQGVAAGNNAGITTAFDASGNGNNGTLNNFALTGATSNWVGGNVSSAPTVTNNAPATYPIGNTTVTWTATDASNNTATCTQVVTVIDNQLPTIVCAAAQTQTADPGLCTAAVTVNGPTLGIPAVAIGQTFQGGKVAYILQPGDPGYVPGEQRGLIAAPSDQSIGLNTIWGCYNTLIPGADGIGLGTGNQNTIDIMAACSTPGIAARICGDLVLNGYNDWYLPSLTELNMLQANKIAIGGFSTNAYWSSSEATIVGAWQRHFSAGQGPYDKFQALNVRAVRSFSNVPTPGDNCGTVSLINSFNGTSNASGTYPVGTTTVTWTATDASGNTATCTQVVTVVAPEINVTGNAVSIADGDLTPDLADHTDFGQPLPAVSVTRTYTITNNGTAPLTISTISMSGSQAANFTVGGITTPVTLAISGSTTFTVTFLASPVGIYNATVNINNTDCDENPYNFAVRAEVSCQPAAFSACPSNISVNNTANQCNAAVTYTATVTGDPAPVVTYTFTGATTGSGSGTGSGSTFNKGITTVTINATNACGNVNCSFTVTVVDNQPPVITCPSNITTTTGAGQCSAIVCYNQPVASDNCPPASPAGFGTIYSYGGHYYSLSVGSLTWPTAKTACQSAGGHLVVINDAAENAFVASLLGSNENIWIGYTDNVVEGTFNWVPEAGCTPPQYTNWSVGEPNNQFGNEDYVGMITSAGKWNDYLNHEVWRYIIEIEGPVIIQTAGLPSNSSFPIGTTTNSFTATDAAGNITSCSFTVTVNDNQPPALTGTAYGGTTGTNACIASAATAAPFSATNALLGYTDNCSGTLTTTLTNTVVTGSDCSWTVTYTFTVTDANNNALTGRTYSNTGSDQTAPALSGTIPTGGTGINACSAPTGPTEADIAGQYTDACGGAITVVKTIGSQTVAVCGWTVTYHYTIRDQCNNYATAVDITFSGSDQTAPALTGTLPTGNTGINACSAPAGPTEADIAGQYTDACGGAITVVKTIGSQTVAVCGWTVTYHYTIRDQCNNYATAVDITFSGSDQTAPYISGAIPTGGTGINACIAPAGPTEADIAGQYTDACGGAITVVKTIGSQTVAVCGWTVTYHYTIRDQCNNYATAVDITYSGNDQTAPALSGTIPTGGTGINACSAPAGPTEADIAGQYTDACGGAITVVKTIGSQTVAVCGWTVTYHYTIRDQCNNYATAVDITFSGSDQTAPALTGTLPTGNTGINACSAPAGPTEADIAGQYTDACGGAITVVKTIGSQTVAVCGWTVTYHYSIRDQCNNYATAVDITYSGSDQTAPALTGTIPSGGTNINACSAPAGPSEADIAALYTDACGGAITVVKTIGSQTVAVCGWTVTYHYTIRDQCNNYATALDITYSGSDQTAPALVGTIPSGATNQSLCFDAIPAGPTAAAIAALYSDCSAISVTKTGTPTGDNCNWTVTYHYVIKDACNNEATPVDITYSGGDKTDPVFTVFPSNMSVGGCRDVIYTVVATDNCSTPTLSYALSGATTESGTGTGEGSVLNEGVTTVTITATDACNNSKQSSFTITVVDLEPPVIEVLDISRSFSADNYGCSIDLGASATDNCHLVSLTSNAPACFPTGSTVVTWTAVDQHGNTSTKTQTVTRIPSTIDFSICAGKTRTIYKGTVGGYGPFGPQSINLTTIVAGGLSPYTYSWSPAAGLSSTTIPNPVASPTVTTTYTLTVTDNLNNSIYASITINVLPLSAAVFSGNGNNLKFRVCHRPPGNPSNPQNINVSVNALSAHLTNGSNGHNNCYLGPCATNCVNTSQQNYNGRGVTVIVPREDATADKFTVNVSPNPTSNEFLIRVFSKSKEPITVKLLNNNGALMGIYSPAFRTNYVVVGKNLIAGTYFAEVTQGRDKKVVKLMKLY